MNTIEDIIVLLMRRDDISYNEAAHMVNECREELKYIASASNSYDDAADCIGFWLGLEPDYMDILLY